MFTLFLCIANGYTLKQYGDGIPSGIHIHLELISHQHFDQMVSFPIYNRFVRVVSGNIFYPR